MPRIPLIDDLLTEPLPRGSHIWVEFDSASQWYAASVSIAAGWIRTGGKTSYHVITQKPENVRAQLSKLGLDIVELEKSDRLRIWDWYTATLGQKSKEKLSYDSLKVADLSILLSKYGRETAPPPDYLRIFDNISSIARFNDEKAWVEWLLSRDIPLASITNSTGIGGLLKGVHSEWAYRQLEAAADGIIDFKLDEAVDPPRHLMRMRTMRNVGFDGRWHSLKLEKSFEVALEE